MEGIDNSKNPAAWTAAQTAKHLRAAGSTPGPKHVLSSVPPDEPAAPASEAADDGPTDGA